MSRHGRPLLRRKISRARRFERLRRVAPPSRRVATTPNRHTSRLFGRTNSVRYRPRVRMPRCCALRNSGRRRRRSRRGKARFTGCKILFYNDLQNSKPTTSLGPSTLQDPASALRAHALTKPVRTFATAAVRLVRAFHAGRSPKTPYGTARTGYRVRISHTSEAVSAVSTRGSDTTVAS